MNLSNETYYLVIQQCTYPLKIAVLENKNNSMKIELVTMIRLCRRHVAKVYAAFVITATFLIVKDLLEITTKSFLFHFRQRDQMFGQLQNTLRQDSNITEEPMVQKIYVKIKEAQVYMFSAFIIHNGTQTDQKRRNGIEPSKPIVLISGWEFKNLSESNFTCCFMLQDGEIISEHSYSKTHWFYLGKAKLQAKQYKCPVLRAISNIKMVSTTLQNTTCPKDEKFYIRPTSLQNSFKDSNNNVSKIGVCVKIAFGSLDARRLIEWFEVHRLFGVDKVITYRHNLNTKARKVLKFYENQGIAEVYDFDLPEKEIVKRDVGVKNMQAWNDEQVVLYDCQERLRHYDYVAVIDTDEFVIPSTDNFENAWRTLLDKNFRRTNCAGFTFSVQVHADTWGASDNSHPLHIGRYNNCTLPMFDRVKAIYMPSRVLQGTVSTHAFKTLKGFRRGYIKPMEAAMHHFRSCRGEWMKQRKGENVTARNNYYYHRKNLTKCYDLIRTPSTLVSRLSNAIKDRVLKRVQEIGV